MTAAQQLWTDDPRHYGRALCAVGDPEDHNPAFFHDRTMTESDDLKGVTTLPPDTDRAEADRDTQPPDAAESMAADLAMRTMIPAPRSLSEPVKDAAIDQLLRMYQDAQNRERDLLDADGRLAKLNDERAQRMKKETVSELSDVVDKLAGKPVRDLTRVVEGLAGVVGKVQTDLEGVKSDVSELRTELDALRVRVDSQQRDLAHTIERLDEAERRWNEKNDAAGTAQAAPTEQA